MEVRVQIPFKQILTVVKILTPAQKARLRKELDESKVNDDKLNNITEILLQGPVFTEKEIAVIEENRESIAQWRTKE